MVKRNGKSLIGKATGESKTVATNYTDMVIQASRKSAKLIEVHVLSSPAGSMDKPVRVPFPEIEAQKIRRSFYDFTDHLGITQEKATELGKQLASVLFPPAVSQLLLQSLAKVIQSTNSGLRIRLDMDDVLVDLPWEYLYRPDRLYNNGISGFLLLDPFISLVRGVANPDIKLEPITGKQQLGFVGTLWSDGRDDWEVRKEFDLLRTALKPVANYIQPDFSVSSEAFNEINHSYGAIFHYAGHCDFDNFDQREDAYLIHEMSQGRALINKTYIHKLAFQLKRSQTRLVVLSACNSGFWPVVQPLLDAGIPAIVGINGLIASVSTIEFCAKLYEALAIGLTLDEAVHHARLHVLNFDQGMDFFDWGLFMVYMPSSQAVIFPRKASSATKTKQDQARIDHGTTVHNAIKLARELDDWNFGEIMSELIQRRVLILGRFTEERLSILEAIKQELKKHKNQYIPELFTFQKPEGRDLTESIIGFAAFSKFIIADLSDPRSIPQELQAIVPNFSSVPVVPIIEETQEVWATFESLLRKENVIKPVIQYKDEDDLLQILINKIVPKAEAKLVRMRN